MMEFVRDHTPVRFAWVPQYADYHPEAPGGRPGGRSVEPEPLDGRVIGDELRHLHPPYSKAPANMVVTQANFRWLVARLPHRPWSLDDAQGLPAQGAGHPARQEALRDGQRAHHRPAQGPPGRGRPALVRRRDHRPAPRGRPRRRRHRRARRTARPRCTRDAAWCCAAAASSSTWSSGRSTSPPPSPPTGRPAPPPTPAAGSWPASPPARTPTSWTTPGGVRRSRSRAARGSASPSATCPARSSSTAPAGAS